MKTKKFVLIICFCLLSCFCLNNIPSVYADQSYVAGSPEYARVKSANVKLYRTATEVEDYSNYYFYIPETYFVELLSYENENFFSARYMDIYGYVKISDVQCVSGVPINPFASKISFRVFLPSGIELRSTPSQSDGLNTLSTINFLETNLQYYGSISGEEAIIYKGTDWYFCKYTKGGSEQNGYVYSVFCDLLTSIPPNTEVLEYVSEPNFQTQSTSGEIKAEENSISSLPSTSQILIIVAICIPCIFLIYLIFRPTRITARSYKETSKKGRKNRKQDYYEYEE